MSNPKNIATDESMSITAPRNSECAETEKVFRLDLPPISEAVDTEESETIELFNLCQKK